MAHPQNSPRGYWAKKRIDVGSSQLSYNSTGLVLPTAVYIGDDAQAKLTGNSTGITAGGKWTVTDGLVVSGQATFGLLTANSTAIILPNSVRVGTLASYITSNSTGVKLGARYISTNTTGNSTT